MKYRLRTISPLQCGLVLGVLYALVSLVAIPFILLFMMIGAIEEAEGMLAGGMVMMIFFMILMPVMYGFAGFIFGAILALVYNLVARLTGGLEFTLGTPPEEDPSAAELT